MPLKSAAPKLTEQQRKLVVLIPTGLVLVFIGWTFLAKPAFMKIVEAKEVMSTAKERTILIDEIKSLERKKAEMELLLATSEEARHEILGKLTSLAKQSGFSLESLTPTVDRAVPYERLLFVLKAQTSYPSLVWFLNKIQDLKPAVAVDEISVSSGSQWRRSGTAEVTQIELRLETYLK